MKITEFPAVQTLEAGNMFLLDGANGTRIIYAPDLAKSLMGLLSSKEQVVNLNLSELEQITAPTDTDKLLIGTSGGTKAISTKNALFGILDACISVEERRNTFRGKNLGSVVTDEQYAAIKNGTFKGLFLGDYWPIGGHNWRIMDFDYWLGTGDIECTTHHLVIMPDRSLATGNMNETNTTEGGYATCNMSKTGLHGAIDIVFGAFGYDHILNHREYITNATTNGYPSGAIWADARVPLPNEIMMYGGYIFTPASNGTNTPAIYSVDKTQLALTKAYPKFIDPSGQGFWLRDVVSSISFAVVHPFGTAGYHSASTSNGIRPVFGLVG